VIPAIETIGLTHRYGRDLALDDVDLVIPEGALYALLGPNGAGKTTLLKILLGLLTPTAGEVRLLGLHAGSLTLAERASIGYVAEGQQLPGWMTVEQLERYLAPLYPSWDHGLANELRGRFRLPTTQPIRRLSRGQRMKVALLCALAPRPRLLIMDEPFSGMDALVKDELVHGLLEFSSQEGWSVLLCSHDIGEIELLADAVGFLDHGRLVLSEPMHVLQDRFRWVEVIMNGGPLLTLDEMPPDWLSVGRCGRRARFVVADHGAPNWERDVHDRFPGAHRVEVRPASLREVFVALAREQLGTSNIVETNR
jgi:ABC-2 type transport system ATP-binding protein